MRFPKGFTISHGVEDATPEKIEDATAHVNSKGVEVMRGEALEKYNVLPIDVADEVGNVTFVTWEITPK